MIARPAVATSDGEPNEKDDVSLPPALLTGHYTPGAAARVNKFCGRVIWH
jgi:hypothetical protein